VCSAAKERVLIVDEEHVIADTLAIIFSGAGYESRAAYSAESALELIPSWPPHLAVVDIVLPAMNGIDFAMLLKAMSSDCIIHLFTGQLDTVSLQETVLQKGQAFEVLGKPVHPDKFLALASALFPPASN
jgi:DNA-binding NtrC family response regulator